PQGNSFASWRSTKGGRRAGLQLNFFSAIDTAPPVRNVGRYARIDTRYLRRSRSDVIASCQHGYSRLPPPHRDCVEMRSQCQEAANNSTHGLVIPSRYALALPQRIEEKLTSRLRSYSNSPR